MVRNDARARAPRPDGFTLAELIVVVVILGIAAAMVLPQLGDTNKFQAMSAARELSGDLEYARDTAITSQSPVTVTFAPPRSYTLSNASGPLIHPMTKQAYTVNLTGQDGFEQVSIVSASFGGTAAVTFDVTGAPSQEGLVRVQAGSFPYTVQVFGGTGRVKTAYTGP